MAGSYTNNYYYGKAPSWAPKQNPQNGSSYSSAGYTFNDYAANSTKGFKGGSKAYDTIQGFKDSPLGALLAGGGGTDWQALLNQDPAYKKLLAGTGGSFQDYLQQIGLNGTFSGVEGKLNAFADSANPSGGRVASAELLAAPGLAGIEAGGQATRRGLIDAGGANGNRSGLGALASFLPASQIASQGGAVRTNASLGALDQENQRGAANAQLKLGALGQLGSIAGQKAGIQAGALQGYTSLNQNAQQAALQALLAVLGIKANQQPQFSLGSNGDFSVSGPTGNFFG